MSKCEKYFLIGIVALLLIALIVSGSIKTKTGTTSTNELSNDGDTIYNNAQTESAAVKDSEKGEFVQINMDQYLEMYNGEENKLILIARPTCHYCQIAEPILQNLIYKYQLNINYLNTDNFADGDEEKLVESNDVFAGGLGTPMLLSVSSGEIHDTVDGLTDTAHYEEFFKKNGYIE